MGLEGGFQMMSGGGVPFSPALTRGRGVRLCQEKEKAKEHKNWRREAKQRIQRPHPPHCHHRAKGWYGPSGNKGNDRQTLPAQRLSCQVCSSDPWLSKETNCVTQRTQLLHFHHAWTCGKLEDAWTLGCRRFGCGCVGMSMCF